MEKSISVRNNEATCNEESDDNPAENQIFNESTRVEAHKMKKRKLNTSGSGINKKRNRRRRTTKSVLKGEYEPPVAQIPKHKFERALQLLRTKTKTSTKNYSNLKCLTPVHEMAYRKYEVTKDVNVKYLLAARKCLLRRDWSSLAKILSVAHPITNLEATNFSSAYAKYALICLYQNPEHSDLLDFLLNGVMLSNIASKDFLKLLTKI